MFKHRLALELGMTVAELNQRMGHAELINWMAYSRIEPFGYQMQNYRAGMVCAAIQNCFTAKGKERRPTDFMPKSKVDDKQEVTQDALRVFSEITHRKK